MIEGVLMSSAQFSDPANHAAALPAAPHLDVDMQQLNVDLLLTSFLSNAVGEFIPSSISAALPLFKEQVYLPLKEQLGESAAQSVLRDLAAQLLIYSNNQKEKEPIETQSYETPPRYQINTDEEPSLDTC